MQQESTESPAFACAMLQAIRFLNDAPERYPEAISFAPGRPNDQFVATENDARYLDTLARYRQDHDHLTAEKIRLQLGQYGSGSGIISDILAKYVRNDFGVTAPPAAIVVTTGCQEAILLTLAALCDPNQDVVFAVDPGYLGFVGAARLLNLEVCAVVTCKNGIDLVDLERKIVAVRTRGKRPRLVFEVADHSNPLGHCLSLSDRYRLLSIARAHQMLVIEDNTYTPFGYEGETLPGLKALDRDERVILVGSFSKSVNPGLRVGYAVSTAPMAQAMGAIKGFVTINSAALPQAIVGGLLVEQCFSLQTFITPRKALYRRNRDVLLESLQFHFCDMLPDRMVRWNRPTGGFFVTLELPFKMTEARVVQAAELFGVIVFPLAYLSLHGCSESTVRLSFSALSEEAIRNGVGRLAAFVHDVLRVA